MLFGKKKNTGLLAPLIGKAISLDEVPDPVFADRILGNGAAILPENDTVTAPADCTVINVADTFHAYGLRTGDGLEILIHIGIDTVKLNGKGFTPLVQEGEKIKAGAPLCKVDFAAVKEAGVEIWTPMLITNMDVITDFSIQTGDVKAGETPVIHYKKK